MARKPRTVLDILPVRAHESEGALVAFMRGKKGLDARNAFIELIDALGFRETTRSVDNGLVTEETRVSYANPEGHVVEIVTVIGAKHGPTFEFRLKW